MTVRLRHRDFNITRVGGGQFPHCSERHPNMPCPTAPNRDQSVVDRDERVRALATTGHQQAALAPAGNKACPGRGCRSSSRAGAGDNEGADGNSDKTIAKRLIHQALVPPLLQLRYEAFDVLLNHSNSGRLEELPIAFSAAGNWLKASGRSLRPVSKPARHYFETTGGARPPQTSDILSGARERRAIPQSDFKKITNRRGAIRRGSRPAGGYVIRPPAPFGPPFYPAGARVKLSVRA